MPIVSDNDDAELVSESLSGNRDAFRRIVERYQSLVCSLAYSATGSVSQSEDLAQETFFTAWKELSALREPAKLRPWLCGIVRCLIGKNFRRQEHEPVHNAEPLEEISTVVSSEPLPTDQTISREEETILWRSLKHIPEIYREPLILFYREHQSIESVALDLELSEDAVKQRLSRGRKLLQENVLAFVEGTLERTGPGKAFTLGIVAALPVLAASSKAAAGAAAAKTISPVKILFMTKTAKTLIVAAIVIAALTSPVAVHYYLAGTLKNTRIHIRGEMRTYPADNFAALAPGEAFVPVDIWEEYGANGRWRVEKPGRIADMDGQSTILYIKSSNEGYKMPKYPPGALDTDWLQRLVMMGDTITNRARNGRLPKGWTMATTKEMGADGRQKTVVTIETQSGLPAGDYLRNKFVSTADTRQVYRLDARTRRLESAEIYLESEDAEVLIFKTDQIEYNKAFDPGEFQLNLPANVSWYQEPQKLADNQKYASMTPEQAAADFFDACSKQDWDEAGKFMSPLTPQAKKYLGGLTVVSLGKSFHTKSSDSSFVPYEIKLQPQQFNVRVSNVNPAKRWVLLGVYDEQLQLQDDFKWSSPPEILTNNDVYAQMSAPNTVKAYFDAQSKLDWDEMRKFTSDYDVQNTKSQAAEAQKLGIDIHKVMPTFVVGDAFWSAKDSAWYVKCQAIQVKSFNLALRKDNSAKRWQVDGGL